MLDMAFRPCLALEVAPGGALQASHGVQTRHQRRLQGVLGNQPTTFVLLRMEKSGGLPSGKLT
jgi:hypothetical protein